MEKSFGKIISVEGQIVRVEFDSKNAPSAQDILIFKEDPTIRMEVVSSLSETTFYCLCFSPTEKLYRGAAVINSKSPIQVPVGEAVLGRIINIFGEPIDGKGPITSNVKMPIYSEHLSYDDVATHTDFLETGINLARCE
jgi:F0F1-type ATP synthase beta subunit